jgi:hypothetical protein
MHAPPVSDQNNANILPGVLISDFHAPGPIFLQFCSRQHGLEVTRLRAAVGMIDADPAAIHHVPTEVAPHQQAGPSGSTGQPALTKMTTAAEDDRCKMKSEGSAVDEGMSRPDPTVTTICVLPVRYSRCGSSDGTGRTCLQCEVSAALHAP